MQSFRFTLKRVFRVSAFIIILAATLAWTATALSVHFSGAVLTTTWAVLGMSAMASIVLALRSQRMGWLMLGLIATVAASWFITIKPSDDKRWAFDVAHGVEARMSGNTVYLNNVRNFDWQSKDTANVFWEDRTYDLQNLETVDMLTSVWDNPDIAHLIVSFGFSDGQRVAFSVETRRENHESFSSIGGFFRQFELVLIAATEEDIIKLRTNHRQEDVRLYPLHLTPEQRRNLFVSYVDMANRLENEPAFYNTLTRNCTTAIYPLANGIHPDMNLDWRVLLSGHLPSYIERLGGFKDNLPIEDRENRAAITARGLAASDADYSDAIRAAYRVE